MSLYHLHEGERAIGAHYFNATAKHYHGVDNPDGALESGGPMLENDSRLIEQHIQRLASGRPVDVVVQDLLETGKNKSLSPHEKMLAKLATKSKLGIYRGTK
ncbi:MAG: hypothetical protein ACXABY_10305 [Candidatus Thorarchaeota archaeon]|jgi:hypothetical protein